MQPHPDLATLNHNRASTGCRLAVDIGGTFTDVVLESPRGTVTSKVLTTPTAPDDAVIDGIEQVLRRAGLQAGDVDLLLHGTTLATNALIERKGARTALVTTDGFRDILEMGFEKRFAQYHLDARRPTPLVPRSLRYEVPERISARGDVVQPLDKSALQAIAAQLLEQRIEAVAIGFLHAYAHPQHERQAADFLARELPQASVCTSAEVCPELREYERFSTTVANAYIQPLMAGYLSRLNTRLRAANFRCAVFLMQSGGGLTTLQQAARVPIRLVESGPAGGAILAADIAGARGIASAMAFDMGGTTAKISLIENGEPDRSRSFEIAREYRDMKGSGLPVRIPVIEMVEIGAGGGSIARVDAMQRIRVGPDSAGSDPGPVAYGLGGTQPTVTDANLLLGAIGADHFAAGSIALDVAAAQRAMQRDVGDALQLDANWAAAGVAEIVEENMANAARVHAVERGREPAEYSMIAFGGAAPLHAAKLAGKLAIDEIIVPPGAGVGSAIGFLRAPISYQIVKSYRCTLQHADLPALNDMLAGMSAETHRVARSGAGDQPLREYRQVELRYLGQGHELAVELPAGPLDTAALRALRCAFEEQYQAIYKLTMSAAQIECVSWSVTAATDAEKSATIEPLMAGRTRTASVTRRIYDSIAADYVDYQLFEREQLQAGDQFAGPAVIVEDETTTIVPRDYSARVDGGLALVLTKNRSASN